jgi:hypothetical protein
MSPPEPLDARGTIRAYGKIQRSGAVTALARAVGGGVAALTAGHVALPSLASGRAIVPSFPWADAESLDLEIAAGAGDADAYALTIDQGRLDRQSDWALAHDRTAPATDFFHPVSGTEPPFPTRQGPLGPGESVFQWSRTRGRTVGAVVSPQPYADVTLKLPDGRFNAYQGLLSVSALGEDFSRPGDSGSLVIDLKKNVVGILLGLAEDHSIAYVLPIVRLVGQLGGFSTFFLDPA